MAIGRTCVSCGDNIQAIKGSVSFTCPSCGEETINRCAKCRRVGTKYTCPKCGFIGP